MSMLIKKAISAVVLSAALPTAVVFAADIPLYGGGATLPAVPYVGSTFAPDARLSTELRNLAGPSKAGAGIGSALVPFPGDPLAFLSPMIFDSYMANTVAPYATDRVRLSYCQTGSGTGKSLLTVGSPGVGNGSADLNCGDFNPPGTLGALGGFSSVNDRPNYIGTDAPLSSTDYITNFNAGLNAQKGGLVQVPTLVAAVTLPVRIDGYSSPVNISVADVCRIFKGTITNWNAVTSLSPTGPNLAIRVVSRSDNSGTTYAFSNFLANRCNAAFGGVLPDAPAGTAAVFTNQTYNPTTKLRVDIAASGNSGVVTAVRGQNGAIGYADAGDVFATSTKYALVAGQDPQTNFTGAGLSYLINTLVNTTVTTSNGIPTTTAVPAGQVTSYPGAVVVASPTANVSGGYPIFAVTYLATYARGNNQADQGANANAASALRGLLNFIHGLGTAPAVPAPSLPVGFSYIDLSSPVVSGGTLATAVPNAISQIQN
ncbi:substrate-binding domain-containing protein [Steroidobacter flavus]|uniref:Substrate-binding domain-containing protein n=1 Tax=Steroidobacter flavus TaxID=1842136 RepID=A0ABV8T1J2_9GAMM